MHKKRVRFKPHTHPFQIYLNYFYSLSNDDTYYNGQRLSQSIAKINNQKNYFGIDKSKRQIANLR